MPEHFLSSQKTENLTEELITELEKKRGKKALCYIFVGTEEPEKMHEFLETYFRNEADFLTLPEGIFVLSTYRECEKTAKGLSTALQENFMPRHVVLYYRNECSRGLSASFRELLRGYETLLSMSHTEPLIAFEDLFILSMVDGLSEESRIYYKNELLPLYEKLPYELRITAVVFARENLSMGRTAKALFIHRNTLTYRLDKIRQITGLDIRQINEAVKLLVLSYL